jgi:hypothetical protein
LKKRRRGQVHRPRYDQTIVGGLAHGGVARTGYRAGVLYPKLNSATPTTVASGSAFVK